MPAFINSAAVSLGASYGAAASCSGAYWCRASINAVAVS